MHSKGTAGSCRVPQMACLRTSLHAKIGCSASRQVRYNANASQERSRTSVVLGDARLPTAPSSDDPPAQIVQKEILPKAVQSMLLLNLGALLFGSNQVVIKVAEEGLSPFGLNALRFGVASLCFLPAIPSAIRTGSVSLEAIELGLWLTAGYTFQALGLSLTTASNGAFTGACTVVTVPLVAGLFGAEVSATVWGAVAVAMTGVSLLTLAGDGPNIGDAFCVTSAVLFGVHKWRSESVTAKWTDTYTLVSLQMLLLAAASLALEAPEFANHISSLQGGAGALLSEAQSLPWAEIVFMGVGTTALTLWIEMEALKHVSAPVAALIYSAEPLWGAAFAWVLLSERWGAKGWVGAGFIMAASLMAQISGYKDNKEKKLSEGYTESD